MNLLNLKRQVKMAEQGVGLLKNKRDALMVEFRQLISQVLRERKKLEKELQNSIDILLITIGLDGQEALESAAISSGRKLEIEILPRKSWGVRITEFKHGSVVRNILQRGFIPVSITGRVELTASSFERTMDSILRLVPIEYKLKKFGEEIRKTNRRVNALENKLIPELKQQMKFISQVLEDREREDKFRLKMLKKKAEQKKGV